MERNESKRRTIHFSEGPFTVTRWRNMDGTGITVAGETGLVVAEFIDFGSGVGTVDKAEVLARLLRAAIEEPCELESSE